jgi:hypothetical protein
MKRLLVFSTIIALSFSVSAQEDKIDGKHKASTPKKKV